MYSLSFPLSVALATLVLSACIYLQVQTSLLGLQESLEQSHNARSPTSPPARHDSGYDDAALGQRRSISLEVHPEWPGRRASPGPRGGAAKLEVPHRTEAINISPG
eukprot:768221-Hanusia_phi.AAC.11